MISEGMWYRIHGQKSEFCIHTVTVTLPPKIIYPPPSVWSKITLIRNCMRGAETDHPTSYDLGTYLVCQFSTKISSNASEGRLILQSL